MRSVFFSLHSLFHLQFQYWKGAIIAVSHDEAFINRVIASSLVGDKISKINGLALSGELWYGLFIFFLYDNLVCIIYYIKLGSCRKKSFAGSTVLLKNIKLWLWKRFKVEKITAVYDSYRNNWNSELLPFYPWVPFNRTFSNKFRGRPNLLDKKGCCWRVVEVSSSRCSFWSFSSYWFICLSATLKLFN